MTEVTDAADRRSIFNRTLVISAYTWAAPLLTCLGLTLWLIGLAPANPDQMDGLGLIRQLSPLVLVAYPLVVVAGVQEVARSEPRSWLLAGITASLVFMIYGLQPAVEGPARLQAAWLHAGFADQIGETGHIVENFDARFSWPAFFALTAFLARAADMDSVVPMLDWAPVALAGMATLAMHFLAGAVFRTGPLSALARKRAVWLATWIFVAGNWTEQDYFSPQALCYVLLISALAVTMRYLVHPSPLEGGRVSLRRRIVPPDLPRNRIVAQAVVVLLAVVMAPTHQLTPYALVGELTVLLLWGRLSVAWLPFMAFLPPLAWFTLGGKEFWAGHLNWITGPVADVGGSVAAGIGDRLVGDIGHQVGVGLRMAITCSTAISALIGYAVLRKRGTKTWVLPALASSVFALAVVQPYGGEIFIRCYLFALPWFAIGGAIGFSAFLTRRSARLPAEVTGRIWPRVATVATVIASISIGTVVARGGNDAFLSITQADLDAINFVYAHAENGDSVAGVTSHLPFRTRRLEQVEQFSAEGLQSPQRPCQTVIDIPPCLAEDSVNYVVITPQEDNAGRILSGFPPHWTNTVAQQLVARYGYRIVFTENNRVVLAKPKI
jgi:uncharacterized membrane protein